MTLGACCADMAARLEGLSSDEASARQLWEVSESLVGERVSLTAAKQAA